MNKKICTFKPILLKLKDKAHRLKSVAQKINNLTIFLPLPDERSSPTKMSLPNISVNFPCRKALKN